jgi:general secretion pathway protein F
MPVFTYRALTPAGRSSGGVIGAESVRAAWQELRARGVYPTDVHEEADGGRAPRPPAPELAAAIRQLATLVEAGVPVAEALAATAEQSAHPGLVHALTLARGRLAEGVPVAEALAASPRVFPPLFADLVRAGEASGALGAVLARLAEHTEAAAAVRARVRAALTYPAVMSLASVAVLGFLLVWVVPQVATLFAETGTPLPFATRALIGVAHLVERTWWLALGAGALTAVALRRVLATPAGRARADALALRLPVAGRLVRAAAVGRIARTLAVLLDGGVPLEPALEIAGAAAGNQQVAAALARVRARVREGEPLAAALGAAGVFPPLVVRLAAAGERSGTLAPMLERAALASERELDASVATLTALVEPALVIVMGAVVLALVLAVLLPLFDLGGLVR